MQNVEGPAKPPRAILKLPQSLLIAKGLRPQSHRKATVKPPTREGGRKNAECRRQRAEGWGPVGGQSALGQEQCRFAGHGVWGWL